MGLCVRRLRKVAIVENLLTQRRKDAKESKESPQRELLRGAVIHPKLKWVHGSLFGMRYWAWFGAKLAVAVIGFRWSVKLVAKFFPPETDLYAPLSKGLSFLLCDLALMLCFLLFTGAVYAAVKDQRYRCRVCLRRLRMPVSRGSWSQVLLTGRPQIEYICPYGHGTLREDDLHLTGSSAPQWTAHSGDIWAELTATGKDNDPS